MSSGACVGLSSRDPLVAASCASLGHVGSHAVTQLHVSEYPASAHDGLRLSIHLWPPARCLASFGALQILDLVNNFLKFKKAATRLPSGSSAARRLGSFGAAPSGTPFALFTSRQAD